MNEVLIVSFRSRTLVMAFQRALREKRITGSVISTPAAIAQGCGLSVLVDPVDWGQVRALLKEPRFSGFAGAYLASADGSRIIDKWG